jgi:hypothetical protein
MINPVTPLPEPPYILLVRKLVLLILVMVVAALGLVILLHHVWIYTFSLLISHFFSDAALGLTAGFSVRWILRKQSIYLRIGLTIAFVIGSLELLGWFTGWQFGLSPQKVGHTGVDWLSLGQLALATGIAILSLFAWTHSVRPIAPLVAPPEAKKTPRPRKRPVKHPHAAPASREAEQVLNRQVQPVPGTETVSAARPKRKRTYHRKPQLRLSTEEEHRCPYCLELIVPDDPRGTVECKICHTLHHADCWAITGACQVPHYTV